MKPENSQIINKIIGLLYPFILLFGFYIILNGHKTPGGGFQGGAVLSAVFIAHYMVESFSDFQVKILQRTEKLLFALIILVPVFYLFSQLNRFYPDFNEYYLVLMNLLIGLKVSCGISFIFFRFILYESR